MKRLLDTRLLFWVAAQPEKLSATARRLIRKPQTKSSSAPSVYGISIKNSLGREDSRVELRALRHGLVDNGYVELPILSQHVMNIDGLLPVRKDPFDRFLAAQALIEGIAPLTTDVQLAAYRGPVRMV